MQKVTRNELLKSKEYWMVKIQNDLYAVIEEHMKKNGLNRTDLANKTGFSKGYITQVLNGDFDHKISKLVELSLAVEMAPIIKYVDVEKVIEDDEKYDNPFLSLQVKPIHYVNITWDSHHYASINLSDAQLDSRIQNDVEFDIQVSNQASAVIMQ